MICNAHIVIKSLSSQPPSRPKIEIVAKLRELQESMARSWPPRTLKRSSASYSLSDHYQFYHSQQHLAQCSPEIAP